MGTARAPYSSIDKQILACIDVTKIQDKNAKLEDFQLRIVADELVLFNLKTGRTFLIFDDEHDSLECSAASPDRKSPVLTRSREADDFAKIARARSVAVVAIRSGSRLLDWLAPHGENVSVPPKALGP